MICYKCLSIQVTYRTSQFLQHGFPYLQAQSSSQWRRNSISNLSVFVSNCASKLVMVWETLTPGTRFVLAACSTWFRQIFKTLNTSNKHPVIVMWETAARDMSLLLDFMYNGVVNVKQENLNGFLALAERLSVRGLTQNQTENKKPR